MSLVDFIQRREWVIVRECLRTCPEEAKVADNDVHPLHLACGCGAPLDVIEEILQINFDAANARASYDNLPLHYLVGSDCHGAPLLETVELLIRENPGALRTKNKCGSLPLHYAVSNKYMSRDVLAALIKGYPEGIFAKDNNGRTPFDFANGTEFKFVEALTSFFSKLDELEFANSVAKERIVILRQENDDFLSRLQRAEAESEDSRATIAVILEDLANARGDLHDLRAELNAERVQAATLEREAENTRASNQTLTEANDQLSFDLREELEEFDEERGGVEALELADSVAEERITVLKQENDDFLSPGSELEETKALVPALETEATTLHDLIDGRNWANVRVRLRSHPDEAKVAGGSGFFPLHDACKYKAPIDVLAKLIRINPDAAKAKSNGGGLPLHWLVYNGGCGSPSLSAVNLLIKTNPNALSTKNNSDWLPLHGAAYNKDTSGDVLAALTQAYPEGIFARNSDGKTPLHYAKQCGNESNLLDAVKSYFAKAELEELDEKRGRVEVLEAANSVAEERIAILDRENDDLLSRLQRAEAESRATIATIEEDLENARGDLRELQAELNSEKVRAATLEREAENTRASNQTLREVNEQLSFDLREVNATANNLEVAQAELAENNETLLGNNNDLIADIGTTRSSLEANRTELESAKPRMDAFVSERDSERARITAFVSVEESASAVTQISAGDNELLSPSLKEAKASTQTLSDDKKSRLYSNQIVLKTNNNLLPDIKRVRKELENARSDILASDEKAASLLRDWWTELDYQRSDLLKMSWMLEMHEMDFEAAKDCNFSLTNKMACVIGFEAVVIATLVFVVVSNREVLEIV